jgi:fructoselysine transporter
VNAAAPIRQLSLLHISAIIVGTVIGSGVFISLPIVAKLSGSPGMTVVVWFLGGVLWIPQIFVLTEMGTAYPIQGGPYQYLQKAGSPFLAFLYVWTAFLTSDTPTLTIVALSAVSAVKIFSPMFSDPFYAKVVAAVLIALCGFLNYRSVRAGGNTQIVLTAAKLLPLVAVVIIGTFYLHSGNIFLTPSTAVIGTTSVFALITAGLSSTLWSYAGFANILYMAGEVKNPERSLPVALIGSLLFVITAYTLIALCTSALVPYTHMVAAVGQFVNPFEYVSYLSGYAGVAFAIAAFVSMLGVLNATTMAQPRLEYAIARDGLFFTAFGHLHPRYRTPDYSIFIQCGLAIVLFLLGDIENLLGYFTLSYALQNGLLYGAIFFLRRRNDYRPAYRAPLWWLMAGLAVLIQLYIAIGTFLAYPTGGILSALFLILSGFPVYMYYKRTFSHDES